MKIALDQDTIAQQDGELKEAEQLYQKILKNEPTNIHAHNNLSIVQIQLGKLDKAEASSKKAIELKFDFVEAHSNLGSILKNLGRLNEAEASYKKAIELKFDFVQAHSNLGLLLKDLGRLNEAVASFKKVIKLKPDNWNAHYNLGNWLLKLDKLDEAELSFKKAIELKPNNYNAHYNLGNTLKLLNRFDEAKDNYKKVIALKTDHAEAYNNLGNMLYLLGKADEAGVSYKRAIEIEPSFGKPWMNIFYSLQVIKSQTSSIKDLLPLLDERVNSKYAQIEKSILSYRLNLGSPSADSSLNEVISILSSDEDIFIKNPKIPSSESNTGFTPPKKITALLHFGRSGTGLLHSLIDGHPEVSTLPSVYFTQFFNHLTWKKITADGWEKITDHFVTIYDVLFDASSTVSIASKNDQFINNIGRNEGMTSVGKERNEVLSVDRNIFIKELKQLMNYYDRLDAFAFFKLVHCAYDKTLHDHNEKSLIFYHIHNPNPFALFNFLRLAPNTKWLMMVREPLQSCESWIRIDFQKNRYEDIASSIFAMLFEVDQPIFRNKNSIGVKLEDLKEHPKKTIPALCDWLGIKEKNSLYQMTAQGKKWWGDPTSPDYSNQGISPFEKNSINRKLGSIFSENDQFILSTLFYPFSVRFGYVKENLEQFKNDLQTIRPMLDQMFDFEKKIAQNIKMNVDKFMKSGSYLYLRSGMIERWNTLNKFNTYPNMLTPLKIN